MQGFEGLGHIILDTIKAFATGVPIAVTLYFAWRKHTIETAKATAAIIETAIDRSADINRLGDRLKIVEAAQAQSQDKLDKISLRVDEIFSLLVKSQGQK